MDVRWSICAYSTMTRRKKVLSKGNLGDEAIVSTQSTVSASNSGRNEGKRERLQTSPALPLFPSLLAHLGSYGVPRYVPRRGRGAIRGKLAELLGPEGGSDVTGTPTVTSFHAIPPPFRFLFPWSAGRAGRGPEGRSGETSWRKVPTRIQIGRCKWAPQPICQSASPNRPLQL